MATKIITPEFRASYVKVFQAEEDLSGRMKYSIQMLFPKKGTDFAKIKEAIGEAVKTKFGAKSPKGLRMPLRDGDTEKEDNPDYAGMYFMNASSNQRPGVVDENLQDVVDPNDFYSGCWCIAQVAFYGYDAAGNKGVGVGLHNLKNTRNDDRLDGRQDAADAFGGKSTEATAEAEEESSDFNIFG